MFIQSDFDRRGQRCVHFVAIYSIALCSVTMPGTSAVAVASETGEQQAAPRRIIPPPLKDLGRNYKVRLVYFVPTDREVKENYREKVEVLMRVVADVYRRDLTSKGHETRGLDFEFNDEGQLRVHLLRGAHPSVHYTGDPLTSDRLFHTIAGEMNGKVGYPMRRACLIFSEAGGIAEATPAYPYCGVAIVSAEMLRDEVTATTIEEQIERMFDERPIRAADGQDPIPRNKETQESNGVLLHELGHIFYMLHDARDRRNIMFYGYHHLRQLFDPAVADSHPVRFSEDHARMAAATRFFSESFSEEDSEPPTLQFRFTKPPQPGDTEVHFALTATDNENLKAVIYFESTLEILSGGEALEGKSIERKGIFYRPVALRPGQLMHHRIYLIDANGNVGAAESAYRVPPD